MEMSAEFLTVANLWLLWLVHRDARIGVGARKSITHLSATEMAFVLAEDGLI